MNVTGRRHGVKPEPRGLGAFAFLAIIALVVAAAGVVAVMVWGPDVSPKNRTPAVVTNATGPVSSAAVSSGQTAGFDPLPPNAEEPPATGASAPVPQPVLAKKAAKKAARPNAKRGH